MQKIRLGSVEVTRLVVGGNPFSGFSHQGPARDREMSHYYTTANIKDALRRAEAAGVNAFFGRTDRHVTRMLQEYRDEGGTIQWFAQTASELKDQVRAIRDAAAVGAKGVYVHGGETDYWFHHGKFDMFRACLDAMRECGVAAGFAGHRTEVHEWIRDNLKPDFQMCSYYDPTPRTDSPDHVSTTEEKWDDRHRDAMAKVIATLPWTAVHYKVLAGGNKPADQAFEFLGRHMRRNDLTCIGHYMAGAPELIAENVRRVEWIERVNGW